MVRKFQLRLIEWALGAVGSLGSLGGCVRRRRRGDHVEIRFIFVDICERSVRIAVVFEYVN